MYRETDERKIMRCVLETRMVLCLEFLLEGIFLVEQQPSKLLVEGRHP